MEILFHEKFLKHNVECDAEGPYRLADFVDLPNTEADGENLMGLVHTRAYIDRIRQACEKEEYIAEVHLNPDTWEAAKTAVGLSVMAAENDAFAAIRPPGHHAERDVFGGFCYFNNASIAANFLARYGKVALLDIDYHHGNGHQSIFYNRKDVLTISIHGNPSFAYPYFTGFSEEDGDGEGKGYNINFPLKELINGDEYLTILKKAAKNILAFDPEYLIVSLGLDVAKGDPTGTWLLKTADFNNNGAEIGKLPYPTLFVQEGGYKNRTLGVNARNFFDGYLSTKTIQKK